MTIKTGADVGFLVVDGINIATDLTTINDVAQDLILDRTGVATKYQRFASLGFVNYDLSFDGFLTNDVVAALAGKSSVDLMYASVGSNIGDPIEIAECRVENFSRDPRQNELTRMSSVFKTSRYFGEGIIVANKSKDFTVAQLVAPPVAERHDFGSGHSSSGYVFGVSMLKRTAAMLTDPMRIILQHSNNATSGYDEVTRIVFTGEAPNASIITGTTVLKRYVRIATQFFTGESGDSIDFIAGVVNR